MKHNTNPCDMIHFHYSFSQPFYNSQFPEYPLDHCVWHSIRFLLLVYNSIKQCLPFCINVSCSYYINKIAPVVPFPNKKKQMAVHQYSLSILNICPTHFPIPLFHILPILSHDTTYTTMDHISASISAQWYLTTSLSVIFPQPSPCGLSS